MEQSRQRRTIGPRDRRCRKPGTDRRLRLRDWNRRHNRGHLDLSTRKKPDIVIGLADPMGAGMYGTRPARSNRRRLHHRRDRCSRITPIIADIRVDGLYDFRRGGPALVFDLLKNEGLCLGGSSAINIAGAIRLAKDIGHGKTIVTILCDGGTRCQSRLYNPEFLKSKNAGSRLALNHNGNRTENDIGEKPWPIPEQTPWSTPNGWRNTWTRPMSRSSTRPSFGGRI